MTTYFTSDHHFGHKFVSELRGFADTNTHDKVLIANHNAVVNDRDVTWFLGDLCMGGKEKTEYALDCVRRMNGRKRLILGNHDSGHPMHRDAHKWIPMYMQQFEYVAPFQRIRVSGMEAVLSHFPYSYDRGPVRFTQYRLKDEGMFLLHGHLHAEEKITSPRELHVGLDAWDLAPVSDSTLMKFILDRMQP